MSYLSDCAKIFRLGLPVLVSQIGMIVVGFADNIMVGHYSTDALASASFVNNLFNLPIFAALGFSYGLTPLVGALFTNGRPDKIGQVLRAGVLVNIAVSLLLISVMAVVYINLPRLGQPSHLLPVIRPYFLIYMSGMLPICLFNAFAQWSYGIRNTAMPMWIMLGANLLNIIGNYILIYGKLGMPEMGLLGAGISTLASRIMMVVVFAVIFFCTRRYHIYKEGFLHNALNRADFLHLNKLGWPIAMQMGMETASFSLSAIMVGWIGTTALAAHQVMLAISQICFMMYYGMGAAVAVRVSNFRGQNDRINVRRSAYAGFHIMLFIALIGALPIFLLRNELGGWFSDSPAVSVMVAQLIIPFIIYQFGDGLQINFANALRGIADVKPMMYIAFIAYFLISLPAGYFFGFIMDWGIIGIWMAFPFGLTTAGILYYLRFNRDTKLK